MHCKKTNYSVSMQGVFWGIMYDVLRLKEKWPSHGINFHPVASKLSFVFERWTAWSRSLFLKVNKMSSLISCYHTESAEPEIYPNKFSFKTPVYTAFHFFNCFTAVLTIIWSHKTFLFFTLFLCLNLNNTTCVPVLCKLRPSFLTCKQHVGNLFMSLKL